MIGINKESQVTGSAASSPAIFVMLRKKTQKESASG